MVNEGYHTALARYHDLGIAYSGTFAVLGTSSLTYLLKVCPRTALHSHFAKHCDGWSCGPEVASKATTTAGDRGGLDYHIHQEY